MTDIFDRQKRSAVMAAVKSSGTSPERALSAALAKKGLRPGKPRRKIHGRPDFSFSATKVAVFVDGCFWHMCPEHYREPVGNRGFWHEKALRNSQRDATVDKALTDEGWLVIRIWEHDLKTREMAALAACRISDAILARSGECPRD